jgi:predicted nucleotidyltransferase
MEEKVALAAKLLADAAGPTARVILFGSHAREEAHAESDIDFVVIEQEVPDRHAEMVRLRRALRGIGRSVDVLVYSDAEVDRWGNVPGTVLNAALNEGRIVARS